MSANHPLCHVELLETRRLLSGVTLITHGQGGGGDDEARQIADLIADRAGGAAHYIMTVEPDNVLGAEVTSFTKDTGSDDINSIASGEMTIFLDWAEANVTPTPIIANGVADFMLANALVEQGIHLAGPSRGASVVSNLAAALGERGVWVDHVTYIDPVPAGGVVPGLGDVVDGPMLVTENVVFADNYWRSDDNVATGFDGQPVDGAHNVSLNDTVQQDNDGDPHTGAGLYYIATVDPTGPLPSGARASWFGGDHPDRDETGYVFSRIVAGVRPKDGLHPEFTGTAHRDSIDPEGSQWANVSDVTLRNISGSVAAGTTIRVGLRFGDADSASTVSVFLDRDRNPYNGNTVSRIARRSLPIDDNGGVQVRGSTVEADPGMYFVYAQIADAAGHVRYAYTRNALTLTAPTPDMFFASNDNGQINVDGTGNQDRIFATTNGTSVAFTRHDFTQILQLDGVHGIVIDGGDGDDSIVLGAGMMGSVLLGGDGRDTLIGADGDDTLLGGTDPDRLYGGGGQDRLSGQGHNDYLDAGPGSDRLYGDAGADILLAGSGNDRLWGGSGADTLDGGGGSSDRAENDPLDQRSGIEILL
jgi:Ca2+-binding RTX toxin-like protein